MRAIAISIVLLLASATARADGEMVERPGPARRAVAIALWAVGSATLVVGASLFVDAVTQTVNTNTPAPYGCFDCYDYFAPQHDTGILSAGLVTMVASQALLAAATGLWWSAAGHELRRAPIAVAPSVSTRAGGLALRYWF
jgi:hypothetical protein